MHRLLAQHAVVALGAPSSCVENRPAARRGSVQGSPKLKAVLSVFWAIFHAGTLISGPTVASADNAALGVSLVCRYASSARRRLKSLASVQLQELSAREDHDGVLGK